MCLLGSLRVYGSDRIQFWRDNASGTSSISYFIAQQIVHLPSILLAPIYYMCIYCALVSTDAPMITFYLHALNTYWCAAGIGYCVSIFTQPKIAPLAGTLL